MSIDEIDAVTGDPWTGYVTAVHTDPAGDVTHYQAMRVWRRQLQGRIVTPAQIIDSVPGTARDLRLTAQDVASLLLTARGRKAEALPIAVLAARLDELARLRRTEEIAEARERGRERADAFTAAMHDHHERKTRP